jgi:pimeloyl-ACP methyl ester carboxylesterase
MNLPSRLLTALQPSSVLGRPTESAPRGRALAATLAVTLMVAACGEAPVAPNVDVESPLMTKVTTGPAQVEGKIGPGALYALFLPEAWNGDLVLYAHGYQAPATEVALPDAAFQLALRDELLAQGYGVAWSSYSETGYAVKDGVTRTRQLRGLFASNFGTPDNTYLMGHSLGGIITLMAAERNPGLYAGALPMCGLVGGGPLEIDYIYDARVLFDHFFPGVLPGDALNVPEGLDFGTQVVPAVVGAILANPAAAFEMAAVDQIALPFTTFPELINSILTPLFFNVVGTADFFDRTHQVFYDNSTTQYSGSSDDAALNGAVDRFEASPAARNYLENQYLPHGRLEIPVLTLHTTLDPAVPFFHEPAYAAIVDQAGRSDLLVQRAIDRYGHCFFSTGEQIAAFQDLVNWVENGVVPTP